MLTADMKRFAKTDLYLGLAHLTNGFLVADQNFLKDLLADDAEEGETQAAIKETENEKVAQ